MTNAALSPKIQPPGVVAYPLFTYLFYHSS